ncbi:hypothetical protein F5H01DRAFT_103067 [Linnemannia elongata]|nr:hypothetical protein F5H01DRAFT_103067 [Linnemannia elongata]
MGPYILTDSIMLLQDEKWIHEAPRLDPDERLTTQFEIAFTQMEQENFNGHVTTAKNRLLDCYLTVQTLSDRNATTQRLETETPSTALAHYIAQTMLNAGISSKTRPSHLFTLKFANRTVPQHSSNRPPPDPPPITMRMDHRGPIFFQFLSDHYQATVYEFSSLGKARKYSPRNCSKTTKSIGFLKAADHVQTNIEYLVLGIAVHATPRLHPPQEALPIAFTDSEHPTPATHREHGRTRGGKGRKRDAEWIDLEEAVLISTYEDHCKEFINTEVEKRASILQKKLQANSHSQSIKDTELAVLTKTWLERTKSPINFQGFVASVKDEFGFPHVTEDTVRNKFRTGCVDVWKQVVQDHLQPRWGQVMENVVVGSQYVVNRGGRIRSAAVSHQSSSSGSSSGPTSIFEKRTGQSETGAGYMDKDEHQDNDGEEDNDDNEDGSQQYRSVTVTLSQILRPDLQHELGHVVDALNSRQDTMTDLMSNAAVMGQKIILLAARQFDIENAKGFLLADLFPDGFQPRVSDVSLSTHQVPITPLDADVVRWIEQEDQSKEACDLRDIFSAEAFRFFIARNLGVNSGQQDKDGNDKLNFSEEHPFWQEVSDCLRKLSTKHPSTPPKDHPLYGLKQTINAFTKDLAQDFQ